MEALADLICGDGGPYYRKGRELPLFFRRAGLPCPDHDGSTRRWREMSACFNSGAYLSAIIMMGSLLEGVLPEMVKRFPEAANRAKPSPKRDGKVKNFREWAFSELLQVAHELGWIEKDAKDFAEILRRYRNFVHPNEQAKEGLVPDEDTCKVCLAALVSALKDIETFLTNKEGEDEPEFSF